MGFFCELRMYSICGNKTVIVHCFSKRLQIPTHIHYIVLPLNNSKTPVFNFFSHGLLLPTERKLCMQSLNNFQMTICSCIDDCLV